MTDHEDNTAASGGRQTGEVGPGTVLRDRFILEEVVGIGGMGTVYRGRDTLKIEARDRDPYVAVKVLNESFKDHPDSFIALQREASRQRQLAHPNIATVYDFDRDGGVVFITMEYLQGTNLDKLIKEDARPNGGLEPARVMPIIEGLCAALGYAHSAGFVHADLKPGNCYLTESNQVKILDFGLASAMKEPSQGVEDQTLFNPRNMGALTPAYASPEMFSEETEADPRDDIYGLACVIYELFTGKHPFHRMRADEAQAEGLQMQWVKNLSRRQNLCLQRALAFEREERTPTAQEFLSEMQQAGSMTNERTVLPLLAVLTSALAGVGIWRFWEPMADWVIVAIGSAVGLSGFWTWRALRSPQAGSRSSGQTDTTAPPEAYQDSENPAPVDDSDIAESATVFAAPPEAFDAVAQHDQTVFTSNATDASRGKLPIAIVAQVSKDPALLGQRFPCNHFPFTIGRSSENDLQVLDPHVSRRHAIIEQSDKGYLIQATGSNGVLVNGSLVQNAEYPLHFGDEIRLSEETQLSLIANIPALPNLTGVLIKERYELGDLIHSGVKASTYRASDREMPRQLAIKLFTPDLLDLELYREQFDRQRNLASRLEHPAINRPVDSGEADLSVAGVSVSVPFIATEWRSGGNLSSRIKQEPVAIETIVTWIDQIGDALAFAHQEGVVHGDLKPSCILFGQADRPYVTDFAMAHDSERTALTGVLGAPAFLAPEQWDGQAATTKTDQFSLGILTYMMVTGNRPFEGQTDPEMRERNFARGPREAHKEAELNGREDVPAAVSNVLTKALSEKPDDRYGDVVDFCKAFGAAAAATNWDKPSVFISYRRGDSSGWANVLEQGLKLQHDLDVFLDTGSVDRANLVSKRIDDAIASRDVFVCLLDESTLGSDWVLRELALARDHNRVMIPVFREDFDLRKAMEMGNEDVQALLEHNGVTLLDRQGVYIDAAMNELAALIFRAGRGR